MTLECALNHSESRREGFGNKESDTADDEPAQCWFQPIGQGKASEPVADTVEHLGISSTREGNDDGKDKVRTQF